jgi:hypothetical protein
MKPTPWHVSDAYKRINRVKQTKEPLRLLPPRYLHAYVQAKERGVFVSVWGCVYILSFCLISVLDCLIQKRYIQSSADVLTLEDFP